MKGHVSQELIPALLGAAIALVPLIIAAALLS